MSNVSLPYEAYLLLAHIMIKIPIGCQVQEAVAVGTGRPKRLHLKKAKIVSDSRHRICFNVLDFDFELAYLRQRGPRLIASTLELEITN